MVKIRDSDAEARRYKNVYICMKCNARNKGKSKIGLMCRKCGATAMRQAKKTVKKA